MTNPERARGGGIASLVLAAATLLVAVAGPSITLGQGLLLLVTALLSARSGNGLVALLAAAACAVAVGESGREPGVWPAVLGCLGVLAHGVRQRHGPPVVSAWMPPVPLVVIAGVLGVGLIMLPHLLPMPDIVRPRPFTDSFTGALTVALAAGVLAVLVKRPPSGPLVLAMVLAGLVPMGRAGLLWWRVSSADVPEAALVEGASTAAALGLERLSARLTEGAMQQAHQHGDTAGVRRIFEQHTREEGLARRRPEVLRLAAEGLERTGAPASDVDAMLQRALKVASAADLPVFTSDFPGVDRTVAAARRARVHPGPLHVAPPGSREQARECFGGSWCLLDVRMPTLTAVGRTWVADGPVRLTWRLVAPPTADSMVVLEIIWHWWRVNALLTGSHLSVGDELHLDVPLDMTDAKPGEYEVWMRLFPVDHGQPLKLEGLPGASLMVGKLSVP